MGHLVAIAFVPHVFRSAPIAFLETFAESPAVVFVNGRMLVDIMVVGIGMPMVSEVAASGLDALVEAAALGVIPVGVRWTIPVAITILILILPCCGLRWLCCGRQRLRGVSFGLDSTAGGDAEGKERRGNPFYLHRNIYLRVTAIKMKEEVSALPCGELPDPFPRGRLVF